METNLCLWVTEQFCYYDSHLKIQLMLMTCHSFLKVTGKENKTVIDGCNIKSYVDLM